MVEDNSFYRGKTILITGGTGTAGQAFTAKLLETKIKKIIIFSRDEKKQWDMEQRFMDSRLRYFIGDVRDKERLERAFHNVDYIIHAAALKQVPAMEYNPIEAIKTNILGSQNVINCAIDQKVNRVLLLSSDKAVNPLNLYGATKLCAEKLFIASNVYGGTRFSVVRYGNVLDSRGSVIEQWKKQKETGVLTVTHPDMTRFWIRIEDVVSFTLSKLEIMQGGEIFIPKLISKKILDMAKDICEICEIKFIGIRPGEKLHELLINRDESIYAIEESDCWIIENKPVREEPFTYSSC